MTHPTEDKGYRLSPHTRPTAYDTEVVVEPEARRFAGRIRISLSLARPVDEIVLHAAELRVESVVLSAGGRERAPVEHRLVPASETLVLRFAEPVPAGEATLALSWRGAISGGLRGLYLAGPAWPPPSSRRRTRGASSRASTSPASRRAGRSTVEAPRGAAALSNGRPSPRRLARARGACRFAETPPLPTYLVALVVGALDALPSPGVARRSGPDLGHAGEARPDRLRPGRGGGGAAPARGLLRRPLRLRQARSGGHPRVRGRRHGERRGSSPTARRRCCSTRPPPRWPQQKRVAEVVTHELAHQWFGNWVTMAWWDDLWLNEAFATWMAFKVVDAWNPGLAGLAGVRPGQGGGAAARRAPARRTPSAPRCGARPRQGEAFDLITYEKGGAVLRMIEGYLGEERFREGIRLYMRRHAMRQHRGRRPVACAGGGFARAGGRAGQRVDPQAGVPAGRP